MALNGSAPRRKGTHATSSASATSTTKGRPQIAPIFNRRTDQAGGHGTCIEDASSRISPHPASSSRGLRESAYFGLMGSSGSTDAKPGAGHNSPGFETEGATTVISASGTGGRDCMLWQEQEKSQRNGPSDTSLLKACFQSKASLDEDPKVAAVTQTATAANVPDNTATKRGESSS
ncbi:unnamed protein product [Protopolystoma xenopodis]|uniref:Uncharacterized protein n=1 Tax=Protopolystoma xenopodis TaxID=117903 RepID=A0A3S5CV93_9PLAT|nr:unnamed protein product [Protopolystoma xenopodis]